MSPQAAERIVVTAMRLLAGTFAVVGILFVAVPDGVIDTIADVGDWFGDFSPGADTEQKFWLALAFAFMVVITGIALLVQSDVARFRPLLLVLAAGKAASSVGALVFYLAHDDVFICLLNFFVDGSLVFVSLWCWWLAGSVGPRPSHTAPG